MNGVKGTRHPVKMGTGGRCSDVDLLDNKEPTSPYSHKVAQARAVISHIATRDLSISGSEVARRLHVDRSAVSRAVRRVENDPDLLGTARVICGAFGLLEPETSQH